MVPRVLPEEVTRSEKAEGEALGATSQVELPGLHDWLQRRPPGRADRLCRVGDLWQLNPQDGNYTGDWVASPDTARATLKGS